MLIVNVLSRPVGLPDDATTLSYDQLHSLASLTEKAAHGATDHLTRAHLLECNTRITQALASNVVRKEKGQ